MQENIEQIINDGGKRPFVFGDGRISGYVSALFGLSSLMGAICFHLPGLFTTPHLRQVYNVALLRDVMWAMLVLAIVSGVISWVSNPSKRLALTGLSTALIAVLAGGGNIPLSEFETPLLPLGLDWFVLALVVSMAIFIPMEKMYAKDPEQQILRPEWRTDMVYFFMSHILVQFILHFTTSMAHTWFGWAQNADFQAFVQSQPVFLQFVAAVVLADLGQYTVHRLYHTVPFLWKFHAVHHSSETMDWLAGSRTHIVDVLTTRTCVLVPLFIMGFSPEAMNAYVVMVGFQAVFIHANFGMDFGPLRYILVTPQYHHWHHSDDPDYIHKNYAIHTPIIDMIFGSYKLPKKVWPGGYGTLGRPLPKGIWAQFLYPFQYIRDTLAAAVSR